MNQNLLGELSESVSRNLAESVMLAKSLAACNLGENLRDNSAAAWRLHHCLMEAAWTVDFIALLFKHDGPGPATETTKKIPGPSKN